MKLAKILLRVLDEKNDVLEYTHFCYVSETLLNVFLEKFKCGRIDLTDYIIKWCEEDFAMNLPMSKKRDIIILRELIKDRISRAHPHLYLASKTDRQGWVRVWLSTHMEKELTKYAG